MGKSMYALAFLCLGLSLVFFWVAPEASNQKDPQGLPDESALVQKDISIKKRASDTDADEPKKKKKRALGEDPETGKLTPKQYDQDVYDQSRKQGPKAAAKLDKAALSDVAKGQAREGLQDKIRADTLAVLGEPTRTSDRTVFKVINSMYKGSETGKDVIDKKGKSHKGHSLEGVEVRDHEGSSGDIIGVLKVDALIEVESRRKGFAHYKKVSGEGPDEGYIPTHTQHSEIDMATMVTSTERVDTLSKAFKEDEEFDSDGYFKTGRKDIVRPSDLMTDEQIESMVEASTSGAEDAQRKTDSANLMREGKGLVAKISKAATFKGVKVAMADNKKDLDKYKHHQRVISGYLDEQDQAQMWAKNMEKQMDFMADPFGIRNGDEVKNDMQEAKEANDFA